MKPGRRWLTAREKRLRGIIDALGAVTRTIKKEELEDPALQKKNTERIMTTLKRALKGAKLGRPSARNIRRMRKKTAR
jgi:hypothetical protein